MYPLSIFDVVFMEYMGLIDSARKMSLTRQKELKQNITHPSSEQPQDVSLKDALDPMVAQLVKRFV